MLLLVWMDGFRYNSLTLKPRRFVCSMRPGQGQGLGLVQLHLQTVRWAQHCGAAATRIDAQVCTTHGRGCGPRCWSNRRRISARGTTEGRRSVTARVLADGNHDKGRTQSACPIYHSHVSIYNAFITQHRLGRLNSCLFLVVVPQSYVSLTTLIL